MGFTWFVDGHVRACSAIGIYVNKNTGELACFQFSASVFISQMTVKMFQSHSRISARSWYSLPNRSETLRHRILSNTKNAPGLIHLPWRGQKSAMKNRGSSKHTLLHLFRLYSCRSRFEIWHHSSLFLPTRSPKRRMLLPLSTLPRTGILCSTTHTCGKTIT